MAHARERAVAPGIARRGDMARGSQATVHGADAPTLPDGLGERLAEAFGGIEAAGREILLLLLRAGAEALRVKDAAIMVPGMAETLGFLAATNPELLKPDLPPVPMDASIAGFVYVSAQAMSFDQAAASPEFFDKIDKSVDGSTNEYLAAPIVGGETMLGVLTFVNRTDGKEPFSPDEIELASRYAALCGLVMQHNERAGHLASETLESIRPAFETPAPADARPARAHEQLQARSAIAEALESLGDSELELVGDLIERLRGGSRLTF